MSAGAEDAGTGAADVSRVTGRDRALATVPDGLSAVTVLGSLLLVALGVIGFASTVGEDPTRAWSTVWANVMLWASVAQAGVMFGAVLYAAKGHWGKPFRRVAEGMGAFLPVAFLLLAVMLVWGGPHVFPWLGEVEGHVNREWLTMDGVLWRNLVLTGLLFGLSLWWLKLSLRPDTPLLEEELTGWRAGLAGWLSRGWRGDEEEVARSQRIMGWLAPVLILLWMGVFTLLSTDLLMSLIPSFLSVVWGPYFIVGGWLVMLGLVAVLAWRYRARYDLDEEWGEWAFHDLGKLMFAFTIFWAYLWWSQYLVIWYGNIGRETQFFTQRIGDGFGVYWLQVVLMFGVPFALLLWRAPKKKPGWLAMVACVLLVGLWLERHLLVLPSTLEGGFVLGWPEVSVSLGVGGLFALCYALFASVFPKVPIRELLAGEASRGP